MDRFIVRASSLLLVLLGLLFSFTRTGAAPQATPVCANIGSDETWTLADSPYVICGTFTPTVNPGVTLMIEPGVVVEFAQNGRLDIQGTLLAIGTPNQQITFTGSVKSAGSWGGLTVNNYGAIPAEALLDQVILEYGGSGASGAQIYVDNGLVILTNSILRNGAGYGLYVWGDLNPLVADTRIEGHALDVAYLTGARSDLLFSNLTALNNNQDVIRVGGYSNMSGERTWQDAGIPYLFVGSAGNQRGDTLTIEAGTEVRFAPFTTLEIGGAMNATGLPDQPILFTGQTHTPGAWYGLQVQGSTSAATAIFDYATIEYGGSGVTGANLRIHTGQVQMRHSIVRYSSNDGIRNESYGHSRTLIETSQIVSNTGIGLNNLEPNWPVLAMNNWWGNASGPQLPAGSACGPGGSGSRISDGVIFRPVLAAANAPATSPASADLRQLSIRPLKWFAPGTGSSRVYVQISLTDGKGVPIPGRTVRLGSSLGRVVDGGVTGFDGKTLAYVTSSSAGDAELNAILETSTPCELVRSPLAQITFTPATAEQGYLPEESAPYLNEGIQIDPMPVVQGVPTTLSVRLTNPNNFPVIVDGSFSYYQSSIGLTFGPLAEINSTQIPANGQAVIQTVWVPPLSGNYCIQFDYSTHTAGNLVSRTLDSGSSRRNLKSFPGDKHSAEVRNAYDVSRKAVNTLSKGNDGLTLVTDPAGFIGGWIPGQLFGYITDFWYDMMDQIDAAMNGDPPRQDYQTLSQPSPISFTPLQAGSGISPAKALAANNYVAAAMEMYANIREAAVANDRYGGANEAANLQWASLQLSALLYYEKQAALQMPVVAQRIDEYVAVVLQENPGDIFMTEAIYAAYQARLASDGFTADEIAAARLLGMTDEEIEAVRQQRLAVDPASMEGSVTARMTHYAETLRLLSNAILYPPEPMFMVNYGVSGGRVADGMAPDLDLPVALDRLTRQHAQETTVLIGNPHAQTETINLSIRSIDLPPDWIVSVSPATVSLDPGEAIIATISISPGTPLPQGAAPRFAVEGYIGTDLIGGVAFESLTPNFVHFDGNLRVYLPVLNR